MKLKKEMIASHDAEGGCDGMLLWVKLNKERIASHDAEGGCDGIA